MIVQAGPHTWILYSHKGKPLGTHPTKAAAVAQEHAINIAKARRAGHYIPLPRGKRKKARR